jgi:hypothetical protein
MAVTWRLGDADGAHGSTTYNPDVAAQSLSLLLTEMVAGGNSGGRFRWDADHSLGIGRGRLGC